MYLITILEKLRGNEWCTRESTWANSKGRILGAANIRIIIEFETFLSHLASLENYVNKMHMTMSIFECPFYGIHVFFSEFSLMCNKLF